MFKIMFYIGCAGIVITAITTVYLFFKCNVIAIVKDLTGVKIVEDKEVILSADTDSGATKVKTYFTKSMDSTTNNSTGNTRVKTDNYEETLKNKEIVEEIEQLEKGGLNQETGIVEEETGLVDQETGIIDEETGLYDEETGFFEEEETDLIEEVLADGEYVKELDIVITNYNSFIYIN